MEKPVGNVNEIAKERPKKISIGNLLLLKKLFIFWKLIYQSENSIENVESSSSEERTANSGRQVS